MIIAVDEMSSRSMATGSISRTAIVTCKALLRVRRLQRVRVCICVRVIC